MKLLRDAIVTVVGCLGIYAGVCYAWPAPKGEMPPIPGDSIEVKAKRVDVVDGNGATKLTLYIENGQARVDVKGARGIQSLNLSALVDRWGGFLEE